MTNFQQAFAAAAPRFIEVAYDFALHSDKVDKLWVYVTEEDGVSVAEAFFLADGRYLQAFEMGGAISGVDSSPDGQDALFDGLLDVLNELYDEAESLPTRMIIYYVPATKEMGADFYYGELQPGVADRDLLPDATLAEHWFERLAATGEDSATL